MGRIVAYARVSTDRQDAENQRFEIENYLKRQGLEYDEFVEETISGTKNVRDRKIGLLLNELAKGDTLIVSETSRISRRLSEIFSTLQLFIDHGVTVIAVKQSYTFDDSIQSKMVAFAFGIAAEIERELISSRTKEALARKKSEGVVLGRPVGSFKHSHLKLHGKDEQIMLMMGKHLSISALARIFNVNRKTMLVYINDNELRRKLAEQTGVLNIRSGTGINELEKL